MTNFKGLKRYKDIINEKAQGEAEFEGDISDKETKEADNKLSYDMVTREIKIPKPNKKTFDNVIKKIKRYCKTIGIPKPVEKSLGEVFEFHLVGSDSGVAKKTFNYDEMESILRKEFTKVSNNVYTPKSGNSTQEFKIIKVPYDHIELTVVDEVKPLDEWVILGTIDFKDGIVNAAPGKQVPNELIPDKLYGSSYCNHCNSTRQRNKIVIIKNKGTGETIQVGGSCIKYYLGYNYERVLSLIESVSNLNKTRELDEDYYDDYFGNGFEEIEYSAKEIIKYYIWHVNEHNSHLSKKGASMYNEKVPVGGKTKLSTGEHVENAILNVAERPKKDQRESESDYRRKIDEWEKDVQEFNEAIDTVSDKEYQKIIDFIESKVKESNFMFNVSNKIKEGIIKRKFISYITGACSYYFSVKISEEKRAEAKRKKEKENAAKAKNSNHIGTPGEKIALENVKVTRIKGFESEFGWSNVYNLEDESGNIFVKFGTINKRFLVDGKDSVEEGSVLSFTADVKKHGEFNGVKQTTLGRLSKFKPELKY